MKRGYVHIYAHSPFSFSTNLCTMFDLKCKKLWSCHEIPDSGQPKFWLGHFQKFCDNSTIYRLQSRNFVVICFTFIRVKQHC